MAQFRIPATPSWDCDQPIEIADFWELLALRATSHSAGLANVRAAIAQHAEVDADADAEDDIAEENRLDFAIREIQERAAICGEAHYPFNLAAASDRVLEFKSLADNKGFWLYCFLLLTTRMNMKERQILAGVNAPLLFEEICEVALKCLGGARAQVHRFGTSAGGVNFAERLKEFFQKFDEYPLRTDREIPKNGGDDGLDLAFWNKFSWQSATRWRPEAGSPRGKLIVLAQCKTGTSWDDADLNRLQPETFFDSWMQRQPRGQTNRAFMSACRVEPQDLEDYQQDCLFFDRCRIVDYAAEDLPDDVFKRLVTWTEAAFACPDFAGA